MRVPPKQFVARVGPVFEHSPWIAAAGGRSALCLARGAACGVVRHGRRPASDGQQLALIRAHPDLVGRMVLTAESAREQAAAGLTDLTAEDIAQLRPLQ